MGPRSNSSLRGTCQYLRPWQTGTECCPPGMKTGDQISPPGGYVGGGLQMQTDLAISPSGDVWVMNNWQDIDSCFSGANSRVPERGPSQDGRRRSGHVIEATK